MDLIYYTMFSDEYNPFLFFRKTVFMMFILWGILIANREEGSNEMIQKDTIRLLRECDAGVKMGVSSINDVIGHVHANTLKNTLAVCRDEHEKLGKEIRSELDRFHDSGKDPNPMAQSMSGMTTGIKLTLHNTDKTVADLMTEGCNMGVKSLNRYLNEYKAADEYSKDIAKRLIHLEERLVDDIRNYL